MATMEARWKGATDPGPIWYGFKHYSGKLAFDIGANTGQIAQILAPHFDQVVSVEPCAESFDILQDEAPKNVTCLPCAVSDHSGTVTLKEAAQSIKSGQLVTKEGLHWGPIIGEREIECLTLDSLAEKYGMPDFVKIDTEGHELQIVQGAEKVLAHGPQWVIEVHHGEAGEAIAQILSDHKYDIETFNHRKARPGSPLLEHFWILAKAGGTNSGVTG